MLFSFRLLSLPRFVLLVIFLLFLFTITTRSSSAQSGAGRESFRVMTFNTEEEKDEMQEESTKQFAINLLNENVKVINLQEAEATDAKADAIQHELINRGRSEQVFFVSDRYLNNEDEMGIVSLFPLEGTQQTRGTGRAIRITNPGVLKYGNGWRTYLTVRAQTAKGPLRIFNVHPGFLNEMGGECVEGDDNIPQFIQAHRQADEMVIVAGDFNANLATLGVGDCGEWIDQAYIRTCTIQSTPVHADATCLPSWNENNGKRGTIDHILISRNSALRMIDYRVAQDQKWNFSDHWPVFATLDFSAVAPPVQPLVAPPPPSITPLPATDGTLPWSRNVGQNVFGPTAAWTNQQTNVLAVCTGAWCWTYDLVGKQWRDGGTPLNLGSLLQSALQPGGGGVVPWTNGGPTAGWEDYDNKYLSISNQSYLWLLNVTNNTWANAGAPYTLPTTKPWNELVAASDGTQLLAGTGINAAWTDIPNGREYFCKKYWCWVRNYKTNTWEAGANGAGTPFDARATFNIAAASDGTTLFSENGPTVGWTDNVRNTSTICSGGWCWSYSQKAGASFKLEDTTWNTPDAAGKGQPVRLCAEWGDGTKCTSPPNPPTEPPVVYNRADFNKDGRVDQIDASLLAAALNTRTATYDLADSADDTIDLYDYNELLKEVE